MADPLRDITLLRPLLDARPLAIMSDIDGTLAPIVPDPADARATDRVRRALRALIARGVRVGLITGRDLITARRMTGLDDAWYAANHGLTLFIDGEDETPDSVREYADRVQRVVRETADLQRSGVHVEDKGPVVAFHYRRAASPEATREAILAAVEASPAASAFDVHEGRMVVELRPPLGLDKGTAFDELARRMDAGAVLCLGDDTTDIDMFRRLRALRDEGTPGAAIAVTSAEATGDVLASADYSVDGVEGVEWLLEEIAGALTD